MTKPIIEIKNLSAGYDGRNVLHDINLAVYERDFLGIIGPNGGGKTTLVKCILGLLKPTGGEISFNCKPSLGYLPQYSTIDRKFPISVEEVILSGLSIQKSLTSRFTPEQKEKGKQIIARMGLEGLEHRAIGQLSGGQLQRALLGRAIISDPSVLILDEPSTYIDKRFEARLYELPFQGIEFQTCIVYIPPAFFCFFEGEPGVQTCSETYFQNVRGGGGGGFQSHIDENVLGLRACPFR